MTDDRSLEEIADDTSKKIQPPDPYVEPPNSTVDDWFGQQVQADADNLEQDQVETSE